MALTVLFQALTVLFVALTVLFQALTVLVVALTVLVPALTVLFVALTVLHGQIVRSIESRRLESMSFYFKACFFNAWIDLTGSTTVDTETVRFPPQPVSSTD